MNTINMLVTIVGLSVIGWIVWYFWLWKGEVAAAVHALGSKRGCDGQRWLSARSDRRQGGPTGAAQLHAPGGVHVRRRSALP